MNQTKKRLHIIKLAISITDIETIQLQVAKLRLLEGDKKIQEIIQTLDSKNFARAQGLITEYMDTTTHEIHQRTAPANEHTQNEHTQKEKELIEKFGLFVNEETEEEKSFVDIDQVAQNAAKETTQKNYDALLNIEAEDILKNNIKIDISAKSNDDFFQTEDEPIQLAIEEVSNNRFFDEEEEEPEPSLDSKNIEDTEEEVNPQEEDTLSEKIPSQPEEPIDQTSTEEENVDNTLSYEPIPTIKQRFQLLSQKYPATQKSEQAYPSVNALLIKIADDSYTSEEIKEVLSRATTLSRSTLPGSKAEGTELILLSGSTEDKFAKLIFARELYKGNLFEQNIHDAFDLIQELSEEKCPEALCDLAQFYEYGIGTIKDKKKAKMFYERAMKQGLKRAQKHYKRVKGGLFSL